MATSSGSMEAAHSSPTMLRTRIVTGREGRGGTVTGASWESWESSA